VLLTYSVLTPLLLEVRASAINMSLFWLLFGVDHWHCAHTVCCECEVRTVFSLAHSASAANVRLFRLLLGVGQCAHRAL